MKELKFKEFDNMDELNIFLIDEGLIIMYQERDTLLYLVSITKIGEKFNLFYLG